jgi:IS1 family transposase
MFSMNRLSTEDRVRVIGALVEGVGVNATCRMTGVAKNTVLKLLADVGRACDTYQNEHLRNLQTKRVQCDEIWSFCYAKAKNVPADKADQFGFGDVWTWTAIDADSKLIISWLVGRRDGAYAHGFLTDVAGRLANRVQMTTDGHRAYLDAMYRAFGNDIDYMMLIKIYGPSPDRSGSARYSPAECVGVKHEPICGTPDLKHVSTSYAERQNLTMRMHMRRFTRLTNAFSKKLENHEHAIALYFMHYNFCKIHTTLKVTPAIAAGVTTKLWEIEDIVALID